MTSFLSSRIVLLFLAVIIGLLVLDVMNHGSFKGSKTAVFLEDSGALQYGDIVWSKFRAYSQQGYRWGQKNGPVYVNKIRESVRPYLHTVLDWILTLPQLLCSNIELLYGYFLDKKPLIEQWINQYAPDLINIVSSWLRQAWTFIGENTVLLLDLLLKYLAVAGQWLMENVFIGFLSPENLQRYTMDALNTTQQLAAQTFSWLNNKVVTIISAS